MTAFKTEVNILYTEEFSYHHTKHTPYPPQISAGYCYLKKSSLFSVRIILKTNGQEHYVTIVWNMLIYRSAVNIVMFVWTPSRSENFVPSLTDVFLRRILRTFSNGCVLT